MNQHGPGAIVLGGNFIGLGVVRSLGLRGIPVWVIDGSRSLAQYSRYTARYIASDRDKYQLLVDEAAEHDLRGWVVFPVTDSDVEMLSTNYHSLSATYNIATSPLEVTQFALDKRLTYRRAAELGIATPRTFAIEGSAAETAKGLPYPVILKPAVNQHFFPQTSLKALPVDSEAEFSRAYDRIRAYIPDQEILIQERIPGGGEHQFSFAALAAKGRIYASLVARRTRQYPVDFGSASSFVETIDQPVIAEHGRRFLEAIGLDGMAEVEFKFDTRDGKYKILDVNPRPWGWHRLGAAAGIDFPYLLWQQKTGAPPAPLGDVRSAAWFRELNDFIAIAQSPNRAAAIGGLLKAFARRRFAMATFDWRDPVPFFAEFALRASRGAGLQQQARDVLTDA